MNESPYIDEQILKYREKYKMLTCTYDLENEQIYIEGKRIYFARQEFGNCFSMLMPECLEGVPEQVAQKMFPVGDGPQIVRVGTGSGEILTFSTLSEVPFEAAKEIDKIHLDLNKLFPQDVFYTQGMEQSKEAQVHWFDFKHFAMEGECYSLMFVFALDDTRGFLGTFRCGFATYDSWKPCLLAMLRSIVFIDSYEEETNNA